MCKKNKINFNNCVKVDLTILLIIFGIALVALPFYLVEELKEKFSEFFFEQPNMDRFGICIMCIMATIFVAAMIYWSF